MLCEPVFQRPRDYETVIVSQGVAIQRQNSHLSLKQEKKKKATKLLNQDTVNLWKDKRVVLLCSVV